MITSKWQCPGCGVTLTESTDKPLQKRTIDEFHIVRCPVFEEKFGVPDYLEDYKQKVRAEVGTIEIQAVQGGAGSPLQHRHQG